MTHKKTNRLFILILLFLSLTILSFYSLVNAEETEDASQSQTETASTEIASNEQIDCLTCHEAMTQGSSVHPAISLGCTTCHTAVDASDIPHKFTNRHPYGLSSKQKRLCYSCHERSQFMKGNVHGAILLGCTSCHNPHASAQARLLKEPIPKLCMGCHEEAPILAKAPHDSIGDTLCSTCHAPHTSDSPKLLLSGDAPADSSHIAQGEKASTNN